MFLQKAKKSMSKTFPKQIDENVNDSFPSGFVYRVFTCFSAMGGNAPRSGPKTARSEAENAAKCTFSVRPCEKSAGSYSKAP
jgi:hypothetical protein